LSVPCRGCAPHPAAIQCTGDSDFQPKGECKASNRRTLVRIVVSNALNDRRVMAPRTSSLFEEADDVDPLQHADRSRTALVVRRDDAERTLIIEQRLAVDRVRDDDVVGRKGRIQLGQ
jgi:hypothetical protein